MGALVVLGVAAATAVTVGSAVSVTVAAGPELAACPDVAAPEQPAMRGIRAHNAQTESARIGLCSLVTRTPPSANRMPTIASCHSGCHEYRVLDFAGTMRITVMSIRRAEATA